MRIVKPHGTSETHFDKEGRIRRYVHSDSFPCEPLEPKEFATRHPKLVIAQWVSCIDKVITRPHGDGLPSETQWSLRNGLGKAAWDLIVERGLLDAPEKRLKRFERQWWARIHPYGNETDANTPRNPYGHWYRSLAGGVDIAEFDPATVANMIYAHLYENASRTHPEHGPRRSGLIPERSESIAKSVPARTAPGGGRLSPPWDASDGAIYLEAGDVAATMLERLEKHFGERHAKLRRICAATLAEHLTRLRREVLHISDGDRLPESLYQLHEQVRRSYSDILKGDQRYLSKKLPSSGDQLVSLVESKRLNREVAALIRLGRVIHYESTAENGPSHTSNVLDHWPSQTDSSRFWLSAGQTEIKRNEAFVRIWRGILARAARTATDWADPERAIPRDVLGAKQLSEAVTNITDTAFDRKAKLLFGNRSDLLTSLPLERKRQVLDLALRGLGQLRNNAFHFVGLEAFLASLRGLDGIADADTRTVLDHIWRHDTKDRNTRLVQTIRASNAPAYFSRQEMEGFVSSIARTPAVFLELPAFGRILRRASVAWTIDRYRLTLPAPKAVGEPVAAECQRVCLGLIYDRAFGDWLQVLETERLRDCVDRAVTRASVEARRVTRDDTVNARTIGKFKITQGDTLESFFSRLTAAVTRELRQTDARKQTKRAASKHLDDLRCDVVAQLFEIYLKEADLGWLLSGFQTRKPTGASKTDAAFCPPPSSAQTFQAWEPILYFILHLVPVDTTTRLAHQVGRFRDGGQIDTGLIEGLQRTLDLYRVMHDAKFAGAASGLRPDEMRSILLKTGLYSGATEGTELAFETRGLREFFRFGDHHLFTTDFAQNPVTRDQFHEIKSLRADLALAQDRRSALHAEWVSNGKALSGAKHDEYRALLNRIERGRHLSDHAELRDHLRLHGILIDVLARLLDFAGQWERDLYFTTLALIHLAGTTPQDAFDDRRGWHAVRTGQILAALRSTRDTPEMQDILAKLAMVFNIDMPGVRGANVRTRNDLAHFNCLHTPAASIDLTALINRTRALMHYDRKQENAVSKSVIELLDRHKLVLSWTFSGGQLGKSTVRPKVIRHLEQPEVKECLVSTAFSAAVGRLFGATEKDG